jgi:membrane fusion protein (multidrug efflux system)
VTADGANPPTASNGPSIPGARLRRRHVLALLGLGAIALTGVVVWAYMRWAHVTENDARVRADMITISSRVDGWVSARPVTDGEKIRSGELLAVIDQREAALRLAELRAKLESTRMQEKRAAAQLRMSETTSPDAVAAAKARREAVEASQRSASSRLDEAQREFTRADAVVGRLVSRELWDQRQTQLRQADESERSAAAELAAADAALADAQAKLGDVDALRAEVDSLAQDAVQIEAQIRQKEIDLADCELHSPIDGVVDEKFVQPGEYVIPGQRLFIVHDPKAVWIDADIKETKLTSLKPGQPVEISVDA